MKILFLTSLVIIFITNAQAQVVTKVDDHTIATEKITPEVRTPVQYDYGFLKNQKASIQFQKDRDNALRDRELSEVNFLISEADRLGVSDAPPKPVPPDSGNTP